MYQDEIELLGPKYQRTIGLTHPPRLASAFKSSIPFVLISCILIYLSSLLCFMSFDHRKSILLVEDSNISDFKDHSNNNPSMIQKYGKQTHKKQIFISVNVDKPHESHLQTMINTWAKDWDNNEFSGGIHFVSDFNIKTNSFPSLILKTDHIKDKSEKETFKLYKSMSFYYSTSNAYWYLMVPVSSYLNPNAVPPLADYLDTLNPLKDYYIYELLFNETDPVNMFFMLSRATVKALLEFKQSEIDKAGGYKKLELDNYFIDQPFHSQTLEMILKQNFSDIKYCPNVTGYRKSKDIFGILLPNDSSPQDMEKYKQLSNQNQTFFIKQLWTKVALCYH